MNGKRIFTCLLTIMVVGLFSGNAFAGEKEKVAALLPGLVDDKSFTEDGYKGLKMAEKEGKINFTYTENVTPDQMEEVFRNYARHGFDRIIGWGGQFEDAGFQVAQEFPKVQFVVYNSKKAGNNLTAFQTPFLQVGYVAGVFAVYMSKTRKIGLVSGQGIPIVTDFYAGVERAVKEIDPTAQTHYTLTGSWSDITKARESSLAMIEAGFDVIIAGLNEANAGVYAACEDKGAMVMGLFPGGEKMAPNSLLGWIYKGEDIAMYHAATAPLDGKMHWIGIEYNAIKPFFFAKNVPQSVQVKVNEALRAAKEGKIKF